jgi:hypothetical protein
MGKSQMTDLSDQLDAVVAELEQLNHTLTSFKPPPPATPQPRSTTDSPGRAYLSGRWHRRDGNVYGIVAAQPPLKLPELKRADDPRPSDTK